MNPEDTPAGRCERHPDAGRYLDPHHPAGQCAECASLRHRALYLRTHPDALVKLINGDADLAARLAKLSDADLGLVALALREAVKAGRAAESKGRKLKALRDRSRRPQADVGKQLRARIAYFSTGDSFDTVRELRLMQAAAREAEGETVRRLREAGFSDVEIARELGMNSRQALEQRWPRGAQEKLAPRQHGEPV